MHSLYIRKVTLLLFFFVSLLLKVLLLQDGRGRIVVSEFCVKVGDGKVASNVAKQMREINMCTWINMWINMCTCWTKYQLLGFGIKYIGRGVVAYSSSWICDQIYGVQIYCETISIF